MVVNGVSVHSELWKRILPQHVEQLGPPAKHTVHMRHPPFLRLHKARHVPETICAAKARATVASNKACFIFPLSDVVFSTTVARRHHIVV